MRIYIASDHVGLTHKAEIVRRLKESGHEVVDCGAYEYKEDDDYPDFMSKVAREVSQNPEHLRGVVLGGGGQGEAMVCNRFRKVRAAVYYGAKKTINEEDDVIKLAREHNNANVLAIGARFITVEEALDAVNRFLDTPFTEEPRHVRRIAKIDRLHE
ncbi:MAG TPA: RpiB/LacA/LacB family sugar-phosphate isomerase [Candidatus Paceibacterota bacterium]